jgi:hypothetical protein
MLRNKLLGILVRSISPAVDFLVLLLSLNDSVADFLLVVHLRSRLDIELLNGFNFLVEVSEVRIPLVKHVIHQLNVFGVWHPLSKDKAAHKVAKLPSNLLAVVRLVSGNTLVHRVLGQKSHVLVWIAAVDKPLDLEVGHQGLVAFFGLVVIHLAKAREALGLIVDIWLPRHLGDALDDVLLLVSENEQHVLNGHEGMT